MGRPTKLTPERQAKIVELIEGGNYAEVAARASGVSDTTFHNWKARGEEGHESLYVGFLAAVKEAEAEAERRAVACLRVAMMDSWQAAATYLERKHPDRWGRSERRYHEHTGKGGGPIEIATPSNDERREEVARILGEG